MIVVLRSKACLVCCQLGNHYLALWVVGLATKSMACKLLFWAIRASRSSIRHWHRDLSKLPKLVSVMVLPCHGPPFEPKPLELAKPWTNECASRSSAAVHARSSRSYRALLWCWRETLIMVLWRQSYPRFCLETRSRGPVNLSSNSHFMVMFREAPNYFPRILGLQLKGEFKKKGGLLNAANAIIDQRGNTACTTQRLLLIVMPASVDPSARFHFFIKRERKKIFIYVLLSTTNPDCKKRWMCSAKLNRWDPPGGWPRSWYIWSAFGKDRPAAFWPLEVWLGPLSKDGKPSGSLVLAGKQKW